MNRLLARRGGCPAIRASIVMTMTVWLAGCTTSARGPAEPSADLAWQSTGGALLPPTLVELTARREMLGDSRHDACLAGRNDTGLGAGSAPPAVFSERWFTLIRDDQRVVHGRVHDHYLERTRTIRAGGSR